MLKCAVVQQRPVRSNGWQAPADWRRMGWMGSMVRLYPNMWSRFGFIRSTLWQSSSGSWWQVLRGWKTALQSLQFRCQFSLSFYIHLFLIRRIMFYILSLSTIPSPPSPPPFLQPCPADGPSYRAVQCSAFDATPYKGDNHTWLPVQMKSTKLWQIRLTENLLTTFALWLCALKVLRVNCTANQKANSSLSCCRTVSWTERRAIPERVICASMECVG